MASLNRVELIGYLGGDPEWTTTSNGNAKVTFRLATSARWRDAGGHSREETEWHTIVVWNKLAEICVRNLAKGSQVYLAGRLKTSQWERAGQTHARTEVVAEDVQFLEPRRRWDVSVDEEIVSEDDG